MTFPTPFLTGRPHTLIHNGKIYSEGAVGIAFCDSAENFVAKEELQVGIDYSGLETLSEIETIAQ